MSVFHVFNLLTSDYLSTSIRIPPGELPKQHDMIEKNKDIGNIKAKWYINSIGEFNSENFRMS